MEHSQGLLGMTPVAMAAMNPSLFRLMML